MELFAKKMDRYARMELQNVVAGSVVHGEQRVGSYLHRLGFLYGGLHWYSSGTVERTYFIQKTLSNTKGKSLAGAYPSLITPTGNCILIHLSDNFRGFSAAILYLLYPPKSSQTG